MNQLSHARSEPMPSGIVMAQGKFSRFKTEPRVPIRQADVPGDELQRLRDLRKNDSRYETRRCIEYDYSLSKIECF